MTEDGVDQQNILYVTLIDSPVGRLAAGATGDAVTLLEFTDDDTQGEVFATLEERFARPISQDLNPHLMLLESELAGYFAGVTRQFTVPVAFEGTSFQQRVWGELLHIPYGETRSYQELANALSMPNATRAVGHANGQNRIAIVVPCHRVVNSGGNLGGYAGGLWRKRHLLDLESGQQALAF